MSRADSTYTGLICFPDHTIYLPAMASRNIPDQAKVHSHWGSALSDSGLEALWSTECYLKAAIDSARGPWAWICHWQWMQDLDAQISSISILFSCADSMPLENPRSLDIWILFLSTAGCPLITIIQSSSFHSCLPRIWAIS